MRDVEQDFGYDYQVFERFRRHRLDAHLISMGPVAMMTNLTVFQIRTWRRRVASSGLGRASRWGARLVGACPEGDHAARVCACADMYTCHPRGCAWSTEPQRKVIRRTPCEGEAALAGGLAYIRRSDDQATFPIRMPARLWSSKVLADDPAACTGVACVSQDIDCGLHIRRVRHHLNERSSVHLSCCEAQACGNRGWYSR